ncbi:Mediator of RNA polymerase II transcription subunit 24 [Nymphon striatum]|nr:Mediator of RNA polymerase II transcription subunit 24 [Nymphon striatum]
MDTSKTGSIKSLLLKAWRERWTDLQWGINIKKVLPRGVSGDIYNLSDCILQQALIGPIPNQLVLSYLQHSLSSQVVSYGAVLSSIDNYKLFYKPHCILSLLGLLKSLHKRISVLKHLFRLASHGKLLKSCQEIDSLLSQPSSPSVSISKESVESAVKDLIDLEAGLGFKEARSSYPKCKPQVGALSAMICLEALLNPTKDVNCFVQQVLLLQKLQSLSLAVLYSEIIKSCFMGLIDSLGTADELKWTAFMFLKVPQVLVKVHCARHQTTKVNSCSSELEEAINIVLESGPLLDCSDMKANCECLQYLLTELCKVNLLSDSQVKKLLLKRQNDSQNSTKNPKLSSSGNQPPQASLILRAEPTVTSILKVFLLIFNEFSKQITGEDGKESQIRALLFDISFLMLCHITQQHGSEVVLAGGQNKDSFFETWVTEYFPEGGVYKPPDVMLEKTDPNKVDFLLSQFMSPERDIKTSHVKWHEVCVNSPAAIMEVLVAWEHQAISTDNVKLILDTVKTRMCCLPVCISTWLCSFINITLHEDRLKPMNMLHQFMTPFSPENANSDANTDGQTNMYYKERSGLLCAIIKKMLYDLHPPNQALSGRSLKTSLLTVHHALVSKQPFGEIEIMKFERQVELYLAVDLAFSLFHVDIEKCTLSLLLYFLPQTIFNKTKNAMLTEPYGSAIAKLTVMVIFSALETIKSDKSKTPKNSGKRRRSDSVMEDMCELLEDTSAEEKPAKFRKIMGHGDLIDVQPIGLPAGNEEPYSSEPVFKAISELFQTFLSIVCEPLSSQCVHFVYAFLEEVVNCRRNEIPNVLQFVPLSLISQLIKCAPDEVSQEVILLVCDTTNVKSRKITAKSLCQLQNCKTKLLLAE